MFKRGLIICGLALFLGSFGYVLYIISTASTFRTCGCAPPRVWELQQGQTLAQSSQGAFSIKWISITPKEFRFFYAFKSPHKGPLQATAISSLASNRTATPTLQTKLATRVQSLGQLKEYEVGVIHVNRASHSDQIIILQITPPQGNTPTWQLAPLRQLIDEPHRDTTVYGIYTGQSELPEVQFYGPVMQEQVAYFSRVSPGQPVSKRPHIFIRADDPVVVSLLTQTEYLAIAGTENFTQ